MTSLTMAYNKHESDLAHKSILLPQAFKQGLRELCDAVNLLSTVYSTATLATAHNSN